jgi:DNA-binding Lrp family transcriptional regulator
MVMDSRMEKPISVNLDATDRRLLALLQEDSSRTNDALARAAHVSPATCLRRVRRLIDSGVIERQMAIVLPDALSGLTAILEVTLDVQNAEAQAAFEALVGPEATVQQCYRVATGPDFVLVVFVPHMDAYHAFVHRVLTSGANVRNVRSFFSVKRVKFVPALPV